MKIKIKVEALPLHFLILGGFLILYSITDLWISGIAVLNSILLIIGILMLTSQQRLVIDLNNKKYSEFYWVLGMRLKNYTEQYKEISSAICDSGTYSQEYGKYNRRYISGIMYKGYIQLVGGDNLFVGQNKNKLAMMRKLKKISGQMRIPLEDHSSSDV